jgi:hypothetical protein
MTGRTFALVPAARYNSPMRRFFLFALALAVLVGLSAAPFRVQARPSASLKQIPSPYDLIDAVNTLRATQGLPAYQAISILMNIAQSHAEFMASTGTVTHSGADGSSPFQRALAAGYAVAGGWFAENIMAGNNLSPQNAVQAWRGDAPHLGTMLSPDLMEVGAGVAAVGDYIYYTLDAGKSTGGVPVATYAVVNTPNLTPLPPTATHWGAPTASILPNTPNADGSIIHVVKKDDTIYGIAIAYGIQVDEFLRLNGIKLDTRIYIGEQLKIRAAFTPTPTPPTSTPTGRPTSTLWPTSTATPTDTPPLPTPEPVAPLPVSAGIGIVLGIALLALLIAGGIAWAGARTRRQV